MTNFVIRTADEDDLGFLLFADHEGDWPPAGANDCVFNGFPQDPGLLDDPRARFVQAHRGREWVADVSYIDVEMTVTIELSTGWTFELRSNGGGNSWFARRGDERIGGTGEFL